MNYRNNPGTGTHQYDWNEPPRQGHPSKSFGSKSGGFSLGGDLPVMPPAAPHAPAQDILPAVIPETAAELVDTTAPAKPGGFSLASLGEIKGFVDRMGGLDGILTTVTKVQKVVSSVSQMAPLVKVLLGSFKKPADQPSDDDSGEPKRRRRRRTGGGNGGGRRRPAKKRR